MPSAISTSFLFSSGFLLTDALDEGPIFLSEQVCPEMFFSSDVLRTTKVQICVASQENASESIIFVTSPHTNAIAEVHDRFCAADDHFLVISAYLDYYRSRGA